MNKGKNDNMFNTETMLPFSEIRGDTIILKDEWLRAILRVTWLNLDLQNVEEQQIIMEQYKRFLNGLDFPIQIVVRSTYLDLSIYINYMKKCVSNISNDILQKQGEKYIKFLQDIDMNQWLIYVKEFYIVIPYYQTTQEQESVNPPRRQKLLSAFDSQDSAEKIVQRYRSFVKGKTFLDTRCNLIKDGLRAIGMTADRLDMPEIISLLFKMYNPQIHSSQSEYHQS